VLPKFIPITIEIEALPKQFFQNKHNYFDLLDVAGSRNAIDLFIWLG